MDVLHGSDAEKGIGGSEVAGFKSGRLQRKILLLSREPYGRQGGSLAGFWVRGLEDYMRDEAIFDLVLQNVSKPRNMSMRSD